MSELLEQVRLFHAEGVELASRADELRSLRNQAIRRAVKAGASKTAVALAAGISRPTLYKILNR